MNDLDALLQEARRRLMRVRIEEHRLKAVMARLEAYAEEETADGLSRLLAEHADDLALVAALAPEREQQLDVIIGDGNEGESAAPSQRDEQSIEKVPGRGEISRPSDAESRNGATTPSKGPAAEPGPPAEPRRGSNSDAPVSVRADAPRQQGRSNKGRRRAVSTRGAKAARDRSAATAGRSSRRRKPLWRRSPYWVTSLVVHAVMLLVLGLATMVVLHEPKPFLAAAIGRPNEMAIPQLTEVEITPAEFELDATEAQPLEAPLPDPGEASPVALAAHSEPLAASETGEFAFAEVPLGQAALLEAGNGDGAGGKAADGAGAAAPSVAFFGAEDQADRIAFVVDNSNSMGDGRLETALLEVLRSVEALAPEQSFYVVFYSDTAYGLFHPEPADALVPATRENKLRLREWLNTVEMCLGGRIVDAFKVVETLQPQVVYLLSDGVIESDYAMSYLTEPRDWRFTVHTIGMTVPDVLAVQRLRSIARAHGGVFRSVGVSPLALEMNRRQRIKKNRTRGPVWGIKLR